MKLLNVTFVGLLIGSLSTSAFGLDLKKEFSVNPRSEASGDLTVNAKYKLESYKVLVRDDKNDWTEDPLVIGWAKWTKNSADTLPDGGMKISASLYNESGDRVRVVRIIASVQ